MPGQMVVPGAPVDPKLMMQKPAHPLSIDSIVPPYEIPATEEVKDVDSLFQQNPDFSIDYVNDVYQYLRELEVSFFFSVYCS